MLPSDIFKKKEAELKPVTVKPSIYDIAYSDEVNGTLYVWSIPMKCNIIEEDKIPPVVSVAWAHISAYLNRVGKQEPDNTPIPNEMIANPQGIDLIDTKSISSQEPFSEFLINIKGVPYTLRAKTIVLNISTIGRANAFGDPAFTLNPNTTVSLERRKST